MVIYLLYFDVGVIKMKSNRLRLLKDTLCSSLRVLIERRCERVKGSAGITLLLVATRLDVQTGEG